MYLVEFWVVLVSYVCVLGLLILCYLMSLFEKFFVIVEVFLQYLMQEYDGFSNCLKVIVCYVEMYWDQFGLEGIQLFVEVCGVQLLVVVCFVKYFGFFGFFEMQWLFCEGFVQQIVLGCVYSLWLCDVIEVGLLSLQFEQIVDEFIKGSIVGMQQLWQMFDLQVFVQVVDLFVDMQVIWIVGLWCVFLIVVYFDYVLQYMDKWIGLFSVFGSMYFGQICLVCEGDVMIVILFMLYVDEIVQVVQQVVQCGVWLIVIIDSWMSLFVWEVEVMLMVQDSVMFGFCVLMVMMGFVQSLFVVFVYWFELLYLLIVDGVYGMKVG